MQFQARPAAVPETMPRSTTSSASARQRRANGIILWMACSWYCTPGVAQPAKLEVEPPVASRAMLEFLTQFSELDDTEFELLTAFAERDELGEPPSSSQPGAAQKHKDESRD